MDRSLTWPQYIAAMIVLNTLYCAISHLVSLKLTLPQASRLLAYIFGRREDQAFLKLKVLLEQFGIRRFYTDGWGTYRRHLAPHGHVVGKRRTQQLKRKHLTLRTRINRLVRKTICFSRSVQMHEIGTGLFISRFEFGVQI
jgi:insertion element IS1 protein InsB